MKKFIFLLVAACLTASLAGCGQTVADQELKSSKERDANPTATGEDIESLVTGNSDFALELYRQLSTREGNLFYSPYSISAALAMTYAGAGGTTEKEMAETLNFYLEQADLHRAFNWLDQELASRGEGAEGKDGEGFRLRIANAIWGQQSYKFLNGFLDSLAENYGAGLRLVDFIDQAEQSRKTINSWVSEQTEGKIEELIPQGAVDALTRLVLTNTIYFNAAWAYPFDENNTAPVAFRLAGGGTVTVPMMNQTELLRYFEGSGVKAVELPYDGEELSMLIIMPDEGTLSSFEQSLDTELVENIISGLGTKQVILSMPKFEFRSKMSLNEILPAMGMPAAFSSTADFSGMTGNKDLSIGDVIHEAFVSVDEAGTEAATATAVIMKLTGASQTVNMSLDHPFIFLIRDNATGLILFAGRVSNPDA